MLHIISCVLQDIKIQDKIRNQERWLYILVYGPDASHGLAESGWGSGQAGSDQVWSQVSTAIQQYRSDSGSVKGPGRIPWH